MYESCYESFFGNENYFLLKRKGRKEEGRKRRRKEEKEEEGKRKEGKKKEGEKVGSFRFFFFKTFHIIPNPNWYFCRLPRKRWPNFFYYPR